MAKEKKKKKISIDDLLNYLNNLTGRKELNTEEDQIKLTIIKDMLIELCRVKFKGNYKDTDLYKR